jgi:hypothetical protein
MGVTLFKKSKKLYYGKWPVLQSLKIKGLFLLFTPQA